MFDRAFSIDQNCHPLWDVVPKLAALAHESVGAVHFIEDVDMAFSAPGAKVDEPELRLARERYHRSGGADWGAAVFYSEFLGRVPVNIRNWEPLTGMSTSALAKQLGRSVDDLYDEFSPSDNWQLIGSSYVGDRQHHRTIGDLTVRETREPLRRILDIAREDTLRRLPDPEARERTEAWFAAEGARLDDLLERHAAGSLVDLYRAWLAAWLHSGVEVRLSSELFGLDADGPMALLDYFVRDYPTAARLYNESLAEAGSELRPLDTDAGELPFFGAFRHQGHAVRAVAYLEGGSMRLADRSFPLEDGGLPLRALRQAGVMSLAGKAVVLALQARMGDGGARLALPHRGSLYIPASHRLGSKLLARRARSAVAAKRLPDGWQPVLRVRFRLLDRMRELSTTLDLPDHLAAWFGRARVSAADLGAHWADAMAEAKSRLAAFRTADGRAQWQQQACGDLAKRRGELDSLRRRLAEEDPKQPRIREVSREVKAVETELLERTVRRIDADTQLAELDYWDSRGALLPWCVALGGESFYRDIVARAELSEETPAGESAAWS